ncbi:hypothetical protein Plhal710r2_c045g0147281 [Plasmopara halstedii]
MYLNISESNIFGSSFTKQRTSSVKLSATDTDTGMCSFVKTVLLPSSLMEYFVSSDRITLGAGL